MLYPPHTHTHTNACRIISTIGSAPSLAGRSCKHINSTLVHQWRKCPPQSGTYWVKVISEQCSEKSQDQNQTMQVSEAVESTQTEYVHLYMCA